MNADGIYLTDVQVAELHTALGEWLASTAPEPEAAPEPGAPELIVGRRYRVGPNPTFRIDGNEFEIDVAATVTLASAIPDAYGDVLINDHDGIGSIDPRHLTLLPEDEPTDRDVERDAQVAELARVVASLTAKVDVLAEQRDHLNRHIDRLAARLNQLESDAAKPSPLHQAIAEEIRRAAGAR